MQKQLKLAVVAFLCALMCHGHAAVLTAESEPEFQDRMQWFTDAKFGLFIHYGIYAIPGGEWKGKPIPRFAEWIQCWGKITPEEYIPIAAGFKPEKLDADQWVKAAKDAGMKYMVITSKHHDGFCLWDSALTEYDLGEATTFDRDILGELAAACKKYGLKFGTYYSIIDWHHPTQRAQVATKEPPMRDKAGYVAYMKGQLKELIDQYDPAVMWFDGDWTGWWTMEDGIDLYNYLRELNPDLIINNRVAKRKAFKKDFGTPENQTPGAALDHVWEACWTVNHSWGFKKSDTNWKSTKMLIQKLIDINSKGGNLLLNVGPKADGSWPGMSIRQLKEMGAWNAAHADAVYGAEFVAAEVQSWGVMTQAKGSTPEAGEFFAYVFEWPADGKLELKGGRFGKVETFTYKGESLPVTAGEIGIEIDISSVTPDPYATVLRVKYQDWKALNLAPDGVEFTGDELILRARDAQLHGEDLRLRDSGYISRWIKRENKVSWTLNVPAPGKFKVSALYACADGYQGSDAKLSVGGQTLTVSVPVTAGWGLYNVLDFGEITLDQVGPTECVLGYGKIKKKSLFDLKAIVFRPVER